jgi:hypothetical protein
MIRNIAATAAIVLILACLASFAPQGWWTR